MQKTIPFAAYRAKVLGCWLGKAVGGTLGGPFEGHLEPLNLSFYEPVPQTMLPNDDLDLQVVWAEAIVSHGLPIHRKMLADAWLKHIQLWPDEYGVACRNLAAGIFPPASGAFDNGFTAGLGAAIRTELWACLAPGDPDLACALMREDACVDHGPTGEGMVAAVYLAHLQSAAFVESDRETLLNGAQTVIPAHSRLARALLDTRKWWAETGDWKTVYERIMKHHGNQNFTDVVQNGAFTILGWLAGRDFGDAICIAVNCGQDTDCTGATLGALLGILDPQSIGENWLKPIGRDLVLSPGMVGMHAPPTLDAFGDQVAAIAVVVQENYEAAVRLDGVPDAVCAAASAIPVRAGFNAQWGRALLVAPDAASEESLVAAEPLTVRLTYPPGVAFAPGVVSPVTVHISNPTGEILSDVQMSVRVPGGWKIAGTGAESPAAPFGLSTGETRAFAFTITPPPADVIRTEGNPLHMDFSANSISWRVSAGLPLTIPWRVAANDTTGEVCPVLPHGARVLETPGHFVPLDTDGFPHLLHTEFKLPYNVNARFVLQTPPGVSLRAWLDGEPLHAHKGGFEVPAIHRPGFTGKTGLFKRGWHTLTIALNGVPQPGATGENRLFVGIGDAASWDWVRGLEWRLPLLSE